MAKIYIHYKILPIPIFRQNLRERGHGIKDKMTAKELGEGGVTKSDVSCHSQVTRPPNREETKVTSCCRVTQTPAVHSHNVAKNYMYLDVLLETLYNYFNVLFVQEPPWQTIRQAPSSSNKEGDDVIGAPMHPEWLYMVRPPQDDQAPRVMAFVSKRLEKLCPSMRTDLINHCNIFVLSLFQGNNTYNLMNVYSDADKTAISYLWDHIDELPLFHYMGGDFNVHSSMWDPEVTHHRWAAITLLEITADLDLQWTEPSNPVLEIVSQVPILFITFLSL